MPAESSNEKEQAEDNFKYFNLPTLTLTAMPKKLAKKDCPHPCNSRFFDYTIEDMKELANSGVLIEHNWVFATPQSQEPCSPGFFADAIKAIGAEHCFLGTDGGQVINKPPVEMYKDFIASLLEFGVSEQEIETMIVDNPSSLLDLA